MTVAANWLAAAWDQNAGLFFSTPGVARLEEIALRWMIELFDFPPQTGAGFVTGATMANLSALAAARHRLYERADWNVEADGLIGAPPITVVAGDEAHPTLLKSLGLLGLGRNRVTRVPVDASGAHARRSLSERRCAHHRLLAGWEREHRCLRSAR